MSQQSIYHKQTIEFATVAKEYCAFIEGIQQYEKSDFLDKSLKLLPLLYLKASMLPNTEFMLDEPIEQFVTEELYEYLRSLIAATMGQDDTYLEVFTQDMQYSETPLQENVSEGMTDIYQDLRDFIYVFSMGYDETMNEALARLVENFKTYWGQKLLNTLRQLHFARYTKQDDDEQDNEQKNHSENWLFEGQKQHYTDSDDADEWNNWG